MKKVYFRDVNEGEKFLWKGKTFYKFALFNARSEGGNYNKTFGPLTKVKVDKMGFFDMMKSWFLVFAYYFNMKFV